MTAKEFIVSLPRDGWVMRLDGAIRDRVGCCPLTCGTSLRNSQYHTVAIRLGMLAVDADHIASAADNSESASETQRSLRAFMLNHFGLTEQP